MNMSKTKVGDKFIIEIAEVIEGGETKLPQYRIKGFDKVFFDDKGLKVLKKFNLFYASPELVWNLAHNIMSMPISERANLFGVSENKASFKDISEKFNVYDASSIYNNRRNYLNKYSEDREKIKKDLCYLIKEKGYSIKDINSVINSLSEDGEDNEK